MTKKYVLKIYGKEKTLTAPGGFELSTYSSVVNALTHCAMLGNDFGKDNIFKIILDFIILIGNTSQYGSVLYRLKYSLADF